MLKWRSLVLCLLALLQCIALPNLSFASTGNDDIVRTLNAAQKSVQLAEFDLATVQELLAQGDRVRLTDLAQQIAKYKKNIDDSLKLLSARAGWKAQYDDLEQKQSAISQQLQQLNDTLQKLPAEPDKKLRLVADTSFVANSRSQGTIASDNNLEGGVTGTYAVNSNSEMQFRGKVNTAQTLSSQTQGADFNLLYSLLIGGADKLGFELAVRPTTDQTTATNSNTEARLALNYSQPLDASAKLFYLGTYKNHTWGSQAALNYSAGNMGINYQKELNETQNLLLNAAYGYQEANTGTNAFSDLKAGATWVRNISGEKSLTTKYNFSGRNYPNINTNTFAKNELTLSYAFRKFAADLGLILNRAADNANNSYLDLQFSPRYSIKVADATELKLNGGLLARQFDNANSNYSRVNLQFELNHALTDNQNLSLGNLLENAVYANVTSTYLHNLLGIKYVIRLPNNSALALGERITIDSFPQATAQNAVRHQLDLTYAWPLRSDLTLYLGGGYELKTFNTSSSGQSNYQAYNLSLNLDYPLRQEGKAGLALSRFGKTYAQNAAADTQDLNVTLNVSYAF